MAVEVKEIIEYLGFNADEIKDLNTLKSKFEPEFVRVSAITEDSDIVKPFTSKMLGLIETEARQTAKKYEIDIDTELPEFKTTKKANEKFALVASKIVEKQNAKIAELTAAAGKGNDEKVNELTAKLEKEQAKRKDIDALLKNTAKEFEEYKQNSTNQLKSIKLDTLKHGVLSQVKFKPEATEIEIEGYNSIVNKKYKFDLDETGTKLEVRDAEGKLIPNTKVTGTFKTPQEVLIDEAVTAKLIALNPDAGKKKEEKKTVIKDDGAKPQRTVAQRFQIG